MIGDATESGLVRFAAFRLLGNEDVDGFRDRYPKVQFGSVLFMVLFLDLV